MSRAQPLHPGVLLRGLVAAVVVGGLLLLVFGAHGWRSSHPRFRVDPGAIVVEQLPEWADDRLAVTIARRLGSGLGPPASLAEADDLEAWRAALAADPWVAEVTDLEGLFPYRARTRLVLRRPVIDVDGVLWSADGYALGEGATGVEPVPLAYEGPLDDEALLECAAACEEVLDARTAWLAEGLRLVAVGIDADGHVVFRTAGGTEIAWGRSTRYHPMSRHDWPVAGRIEHVEAALARDPGLERTARIDVYLDRLRIVPAAGGAARGGR